MIHVVRHRCSSDDSAIRRQQKCRDCPHFHSDQNDNPIDPPCRLQQRMANEGMPDELNGPELTRWIESHRVWTPCAWRRALASPAPHPHADCPWNAAAGPAIA